MWAGSKYIVQLLFWSRPYFTTFDPPPTVCGTVAYSIRNPKYCGSTRVSFPSFLLYLLPMCPKKILAISFPCPCPSSHAVSWCLVVAHKGYYHPLPPFGFSLDILYSRILVSIQCHHVISSSPKAQIRADLLYAIQYRVARNPSSLSVQLARDTSGSRIGSIVSDPY